MFLYKSILFTLFVSPFIFHSNANEILKKFKPRGQQNEVIIRRVRNEDIDESAELIREAYLKDCLKLEHATPEQCEQMGKVPLERTLGALRGFQREKQSVLMVAENTAPADQAGSSNGPRLLGCIRVKLNSKGNTKDNGPYAQITPFATRVDFQGWGIGGQMLSAAEEYAVKQWEVCEMQLEAHGIPTPVPGIVHPMTPLLKFYANREYRRIGKTNWFDPAAANYVKIPDQLTHLEVMVKDLCGKGTKHRREEKKGEAAEGEGSAKQLSEIVENPAVDAVKGKGADAVAELAEAAVDLAHEFGLIKRLSDDESRRRRTSDLASVQPFALFPCPFPRSLFLRAIDVHKGMQKLFFRVSCDYEFLIKATEEIAKKDKVYKRALKLMDEVRREGQRQPYTLFLARSDYVLGRSMQQQLDLEQTGVVIGGVGSVAMSARAAEVHRQMLQKLDMDFSNVPQNRALNTMARALFQGWLRFGDPDALVVFIVSPEGKFRFDERAIEYELQQISDGQVELVRMLSEEAFSKLFLDETDFTLRLADGRVVGLVHSSVGPLSELTADEWAARRRIERSRAIKTSTVFSDLGSSKAVQQLLSQPGKVERFLRDSQDAQMVEAIRRSWPLGTEDGAHPVTVENYFVRPLGECVLARAVVELGIFGFLLADTRDQSIVLNEQNGFVARSKLADAAADEEPFYDSLNLF